MSHCTSTRYLSSARILSLSLQSLAARVEALESTLAPPLKALTEKLTDLEKAIANHSPLGPLDSSDLRNTLNVVKALAMQVFTHCAVPHALFGVMSHVCFFVASNRPTVLYTRQSRGCLTLRLGVFK